VVLDKLATVVFCGDHGIEMMKVSRFPREVTFMNMKSMALGKATVSAFTRSVGSTLFVVDIGVDGPKLHLTGPTPPHITFIDRRLGSGTRNFLYEGAMSEAQVIAAIDIGYQIGTEVSAAADVVALGEMGIANTSVASVLTACLSGMPIEDVTGPGTGVNGARLLEKQRVLAESIRRTEGRSLDPFGVLREYGGFEIAALVGAMLACAVQHRPVVLDGFVVGAAALAACALAPNVRSYLIAGTQSTEPGHAVILKSLELRPLLRLGMRLGEASAAVLALPVLRAAAAQLSEIGLMAELTPAGSTVVIEP